MAIYYVDPTNGNDADDGLSWANAFLTLNGAEDEPVAANDTVYVGPGVYPELLTCDVDGAAGQPITYIADVTGENTDSVGGIVRITGSDDDKVTARARCITVNGKDYRTFRGFFLDTASNELVHWSDALEHLILEDCVFHGRVPGVRGTAGVDNLTIRRCILIGGGILVDLGGAYAGSDNLIENILIIGAFYNSSAIQVDRCDGFTVKHVTTVGGYDSAIRAQNLNSNGYSMNVYNCALFSGRYGTRADAIGGIVENYNSFDCATERVNTNVGANSITSTPLLLPTILFDEYKFPWWFGELSEWSQIKAITGTSMSADDLRGFTRPVTDSKKSWGGVQFLDSERETTTTRGGSDASIVFNDAGRHQIWVPVENSSTDISVYVYREANYAGNNPQMIIKQPGQADDVTTDAAAASQWNELTTTLTPAAIPPYVIVELVSRNTDAANPATNDVFFDDLVIS